MPATRGYPGDLSNAAVLTVKQGVKDVEYPATITFVSPEIDPARQTFAIWAEVQNPEGVLRSGNVGQLQIQLKK